MGWYKHILVRLNGYATSFDKGYVPYELKIANIMPI